MDKEIAHHVAYEAFKASSRLGPLIPLLKENCDQEEYEMLAKKIASITGDIGIEILRYVFSIYPDIENEFDRQIQKNGKLARCATQTE
ncbi:hypothetical protein Dalk_2212 [Desulfatibacillum aliphaticivorans]|uniref:Uncharacterized protein n=1 Tax=Desulfatibacillum aliphaticivorans TaxID=218208 RepID=B8FF88_DESAL|nr:hypothetical protein [Desulfatibacillum aliphaticivorans]ACL03905.1 hypothetical protein Dalk_2212 [Desulfatibacillum aliphaticivorans]